MPLLAQRGRWYLWATLLPHGLAALSLLIWPPQASRDGLLGLLLSSGGVWLLGHLAIALAALVALALDAHGHDAAALWLTRRTALVACSVTSGWVLTLAVVLVWLQLSLLTLSPWLAIVLMHAEAIGVRRMRHAA